MCEPSSIAYAAAAIVGGIVASKAMTPKVQNAPAELPAAATPAAPTTVTPPLPATQTPAQPSKTPAIQQLKTANAATTGGRNASSISTMLTGPTGVDLTGSTIGKNTLLGQ